MKILLISIFLLCSLVSCQPLRKQEVLLHQVIDSHAKSQKKKYGISLIGSGGSIPDNEIKEFIVHYVANYPMLLEEARSLYVQSVEELLVLINSNKEIQPYLENYPFSINNIEYNLSFWDPYSDRFDPPSVALVFLVRGNICYAFYDNRTGRFTYEMDVREPYSEARRLVLGDDASTNYFE